MKRAITQFLITLAATALTSCGGGGTTVAEGGIGGTGVSMGRVTQVGSVYVNGIHYNTDSATFTVDDVTSPTLSDISVGMVVRVTGSSDPTAGTGVADTVEYDSLLKGPVDVAFLANQLGAMGQVINVNADTVYEGTAGRPLVDDLVIGDLIEVSGFTDGDSGTILATRIEVKSTITVYELTGDVTAISGTTFQIGGLTIEAGLLTIPPAGTYIEVEGSSPPTGMNFNADSISTIGNGDGTVADDGEDTEFEGQITTGLGDITGEPNQFIVNSQIVEIQQPGTDFEGGSTSDLTAGRIVEVEGVMNGTILLAEEIEIEASASEKSKIEGVLGVGNVDLTANTVTLLDRVIQIDNATILENDLGGSSTFALADLISSDYLEATVYDDNGVLTASKLERETLPSGHTAALEGLPVDNGGNFEILGIIIDPGGTGYNFTPLQRIEVKGNYSSGTLTATSITPSD
ncbi:MAG: hypothetical protein KZQ75_13335 [Candidatus Thiodiazotropha sp. (ex Myrtea spinifera)]|nr:hypothetical protein [Candidatus Thiodiazotropha sp. (ex Myrtea spinifera)]MCU7828959.1 hypothetical protein [Candidatus Thiodiazotropha sp. (ex Myrtea sp. 'scaly one' KF741663)]